MLNANNIEKLKPFYFDQFTINDQKITISRTGFSGDLGYELWCDPSQAHDVWDALFSFNKDYKILAAGLNALDMVRVEAGFIVVNADLIAAEHALRPNRMRTPFELGLAWMENLDKEERSKTYNRLNELERYQRKVRRGHTAMKRRLIGYGGNKNVSPYSKKPSMKRAKSAPAGAGGS